MSIRDEREAVLKELYRMDLVNDFSRPMVLIRTINCVFLINLWQTKKI